MGPANTLLLRLGLGLFLALNTMAFSFLFYSQELYPFPVSTDPSGQMTAITGLFSYLLLLLGTAAVLALGAPLAADTLERVRACRPRWRAVDANLLILIGVLAAYALSATRTFRGESPLYYDTAAMILVLTTLGQYLDSTARRRVSRSALELLEQPPARAWVYRDGQAIEVDTNSLAVGDEVRVRPGETVPVDGHVIQGRSHADESTLTGESRPREVGPGDAVLAGSINYDGSLRIVVRSIGQDRVIARLHQLLEEARLRQPPIQRLADRVAAVFVPAVVLLALAVWGYHSLHHQPTRGLFDALSVLLISCPCALGLSTPLAVWNTLARAQRLGVVIDSGATLERAAAVKTVLFDKTGTLTTARMTVTEAEVVQHGLSADHALAIAAAIESGTLHPAARAIEDHAAQRHVALPAAADIQMLPGLGVEGSVAGRKYRVGSPRMLGKPSRDAEAPQPCVYLTSDQGVMARFILSEELRPEAPDTIAQLRAMGIGARVLTGDQPGPAARLGQSLGVPVDAKLLPADKLTRLEQTRAETRGAVAMVGDGINDGPVLAAADVGFALASATDLAQRAGHVRVLADRLDRVPLTLKMARHAMRRIRLNLLWSFGYNTIGISLAAMGYLSPVFSASAMVVSSLLIATTSAGAGDVGPANAVPDGGSAP